MSNRSSSDTLNWKKSSSLNSVLEIREAGWDSRSLVDGSKRHHQTNVGSQQLTCWRRQPLCAPHRVRASRTQAQTQNKTHHNPNGAKRHVKSRKTGRETHRAASRDKSASFFRELNSARFHCFLQRGLHVALIPGSYILAPGW